MLFGGTTSKTVVVCAESKTFPSSSNNVTPIVTLDSAVREFVFSI